MIYDFLVIGAGISGASVAHELAGSAQVVLAEAETAAGYHSTGRSAALFTRNFGGPVVRKINAVSEEFYRAPPESLVEGPLLHPKGALAVAAPGEEAHLDGALAFSEPGHEIERIAASDVLAMAPFLRPERVSAAAYEAGVAEIDVARLLAAYLAGFRRRGGEVLTECRIAGLRRANGIWTATSARHEVQARCVVNAAGAWAGEIGALAGAADIGLVPKRRSAILVDMPPEMRVSPGPVIEFLGTTAYVKPDAGKLMASIGDATPTAPADARPDEMDIALAADLVERETTLKIRHIAHSWAGLRSFVADDAPVVGFDDTVEGFFWLAGQGGFGIMMAPTLADLSARLCLGQALPGWIGAPGIDLQALAPGRCQS